ncbi:hypothetical protein BYT27DRAFT_7207491 [Phlegmacium glaucopus]|nr:hypothetical protein BYT27DRAFT_7207491 [Phlegmacium glaucopus]
MNNEEYASNNANNSPLGELFLFTMIAAMSQWAVPPPPLKLGAAMSHPISPCHDDEHYPLEVCFLRGVMSDIMGQDSYDQRTTHMTPRNIPITCNNLLGGIF